MSNVQITRSNPLSNRHNQLDTETHIARCQQTNRIHDMRINTPRMFKRHKGRQYRCSLEIQILSYGTPKDQ
jgi:hypothetical protein